MKIVFKIAYVTYSPATCFLHQNQILNQNYKSHIFEVVCIPTCFIISSCEKRVSSLLSKQNLAHIFKKTY